LTFSADPTIIEIALSLSIRVSFMLSIGQKHRLALLGVGITLALLILLGGFHHHDEDAGKACWYCIAVVGAFLPLAVVLPALAIPFLFRLPAGSPIPTWFRWVTHHRRGPPRADLQLNRVIAL